MILPLGHEQTSVRRLPWVTFSIMILCVVAWVLTMSAAKRAEERRTERGREATEFFLEHPYLEYDARLRERIPALWLDQFDASLELAREIGPKPPDDRRVVDEEQRRFRELVDALFEARDAGPYFTWGLVPADISLHGLISYQFMHAGFFHLLGNMFLLYLAGPFIEDVWGRPLFAGFYLGAGTIAALFFAARYPGFDGPLIGASGAVSGVIGAFMVRFWHARIRFFYWLFFFFVGTFTAPAWLMLPLWFLKELFFAQAMDVVSAGGTGGGVAYWAHVAGFGFGVVTAVVIRTMRVEERFIDTTIESKITLHENQGIEEAMEAAAAGRLDEGASRLEKELGRDPRNLDAAVALLTIAERRGEPQAAVPHLLRALEHAARDDDGEIVANHWQTISALDEGIRLEPAPAARIAEALDRAGYGGLAADVVARSVDQVDAATPPGVAVRLARLATALEVATARRFVDAAIDHPEIPAETAAELEKLREDTPESPPPPPAENPRGGHPAAPAGPADDPIDTQSGRDDRAPIEVAPILGSADGSRKLKVVEAVPLALDGESLEIGVSGARRRMSLAEVQAIGVGGIRPQDGSPFLVVDLLLDSVLSQARSLRVVRLLSSTYDPRRLVEAESAMAAFRALLEHLVRTSEAVPLPDVDGALGRPFRSFASVADYEREVLGVG